MSVATTDVKLSQATQKDCPKAAMGELIFPYELLIFRAYRGLGFIVNSWSYKNVTHDQWSSTTLIHASLARA